MGEILYRSYEPDMEIAKGGDGRTVEGIVVPFNYVQRINADLTEQFARGAFDHQFNAARRVPFRLYHNSEKPLGVAQEMRNDTAGLFMSFKVSKTQLGDETLELIKDGALTDLSIGFRQGKDRVINRGNQRVTERVKAHLFEVSVVPEGAYGEQAMIAAVRAEEQSQKNLDRAKQILAGMKQLPIIGG